MISGHPFMTNAPANVDDRNGALQRFEMANSLFAVSRRIGVNPFDTFFSLFVMVPSPTMSTHDPLSTTQRRDPADVLFEFGASDA